MNEALIDSQRLFEGRYISVRVDTVRLLDGTTTTREVVEHPGAVAIVPIDEEQNVILVKQFRYVTGQSLLEIPAGTREAGEPPEACAMRELAEETGHSAGRLEKLFQVYLAPGYSTELIHYYLATELQPAHAVGDHDEFIEVVRIPLGDALRMIDSGQFEDAKTVAAIAMATRRLGVTG